MPEDSFLEAVAAVDSAAFTIDSFALRNLVFNRPVEAEVLSSLSLMEGRFVQRVRCLSEREEECVVSSVPPPGPATPPAFQRGTFAAQGAGR